MNLIKTDNSSEYENQQEWFFKNHKIRTLMINGMFWWILKDICDALGINNPSAIANRLDEDEKWKIDPKQYLGSRSNEPIILVSESGVYNVIMLSRKPEAKQFKRWITHDVLPSIRKHGAYFTASTAEKLLNDPDVLITMLNTIKEERLEKKRLQNQVEADKPKVLFADAVSASDGTVLIGELAKILRGNGVEIGQNRLYDRLRLDGFLIKRNGTDYNMPTQKAMELGLFKIKETSISHSDGHITVSKTTKVTGRGQLYFIDYFLNKRKFSYAD